MPIHQKVEDIHYKYNYKERCRKTDVTYKGQEAIMNQGTKSVPANNNNHDYDDVHEDNDN